jgi:mannosyltransferase
VRDRHPLILVGLVLLCLALRLAWIAHHELAHDEPFTVLQAHRSLAGLWAILPEENNPPLHFLLMHLWVDLVPLEEGWLRLPSAVFSALTIWPLFLLARSMANVRTAITACLLFTLSSYHQGFAHEVRAYSLFALLATTSMWQLYRLVQGRGMIWLLTVNILMVYTHFFGWLMIGIQVLCVLLVKEWRKALVLQLMATGIVLFSYTPYLLIFLRRVGTSVSEGTWLERPHPEELYNMLWRWSNAPVAVVLLLVVLVVHLVRTRASSVITRIGIIWAFVPLLGMFAASYAAPMFLDRYLVYASPGFLLLCAWAIHSTGYPQRWGMVLAAGIVAVFLFSFKPYREQWPIPSGVVQAVASLPDAPVYIHPWWYVHTYAWHLDRQLLTRPELLDEHLATLGIHALGHLDSLPDLLARQGRITVVVAGAEQARALQRLQHTRSWWTTAAVQADRNVLVDQFLR